MAAAAVKSMDCRLLRKTLRKEAARCLVLDCRPYLAFSALSVRGSLNVNLNSVVIRRVRGGPAPVHFVVPDEAARARLRDGGVSAVVVLDEATAHWRKLREDSTAQIALNTLLSLQAAPKVCFLKGGFTTFYSQYPECCIEEKSFSLEGSEMDRNLNNHCDKQGSNPKPPYDQGNPVEILPFLYLGSAYHASRCEFLANLHITALLNVSRKNSDSFKEQYHYKWIPVEDNHTADISSHFQEAIDFIDTVRHAGGRVLVHCEAGISRSPTICMAYLMKTKRLRLEEAFDYIKHRRSMISPNFGFMGQLLHYEAEILSSTGSPHMTSCKREAVSFFTEELTLSKSFDGSCYVFPTSVLTSVPIRSPVHQLKVSPITASSSC
ncbi:dual specificity protein phosphatase 5 [Rhinatrema bivittatum]|uniref:dual specificity protein phosphatase 5 n=1 Tax=Rhinatrema bivittatum TaxID=194408 RepID=UPI0011283639|nr:dual specificity protein phosphatase 5 [Rhinatrema bivittatum]